ncbi:hypothetical protein P154DRAFT_354315 [Amniculicola lignicola CBS 123094]|uniref:DUF7580 domain-containing protein n=1 Tax=Amniculicola lignicola CBS 123094 TaxID=1392246 RepID=A0A6A5WW53_9PLEO|nr:hypothetical protein P154DRAFT_354315 [Amniculicola lignicola CBS 123094]
MSGIEVAGLVFGIIPLLIETLKSYSKVSSSFHTFRHWSKEVKKLQIQLKVHHGIFCNECRLLLRLVEGEKGANDMMDDESDQRWKSKEVNERMSKVLKNNLELCQSIIEASKDTVDELNEELKRFEVFYDQKLEHESIKVAARRLRNAIKMTFDKSKYLESLSSLRDRNTELTQIRSHLAIFSQQKTCSDGWCIAKKPLPAHINSIRTASKQLHEALSSNWCCSNPTARHSARICIDAKVEAGVRVDLAISCRASPAMEPPIWLYVQSIRIDTLGTKCPAASAPPCNADRQGASAPSVIISHKREQSDLIQIEPKRKPKPRQVRFADSHQEPMCPRQTTIAAAITTIVAKQTTPEINLCQTKNICHYLKQNFQLCGNIISKHCVGYLESPKLYKHMFYLHETPISSRATHNSNQPSIYSITDLMVPGLDEPLTMVDQLKLAQKTAIGLLQFNDTPWLAERWRLKDVAYFGFHNSLDDSALKTIHLSSQISTETLPPPLLTTLMEGIVQDPTSIQPISEEDYYGINNLPLFFLGVALLELAHWKTLESMSKPADPNLILTARRLANMPTTLGPRYQDIMRKCLQCNFGFGTDLGKRELQSAVYGDVVGPLEKMIESLSI